MRTPGGSSACFAAVSAMANGSAHAPVTARTARSAASVTAWWSRVEVVPGAGRARRPLTPALNQCLGRVEQPAVRRGQPALCDLPVCRHRRGEVREAHRRPGGAGRRAGCVRRRATPCRARAWARSSPGRIRPHDGRKSPQPITPSGVSAVLTPAPPPPDRIASNDDRRLRGGVLSVRGTARRRHRATEGGRHDACGTRPRVRGHAPAAARHGDGRPVPRSAPGRTPPFRGRRRLTRRPRWH